MGVQDEASTVYGGLVLERFRRDWGATTFHSGLTSLVVFLGTKWCFSASPWRLPPLCFTPFWRMSFVILSTA